jgi:hypothetical protein
MKELNEKIKQSTMDVIFFYNHRFFWFLIFFATFRLSGFSQKPAITWGDQGNGTYLNPVLNADYSDPDAFRVGDDYFMVCSEFHFMGMPVLRSLFAYKFGKNHHYPILFIKIGC